MRFIAVFPFSRDVSSHRTWRPHRERLKEIVHALRRQRHVEKSGDLLRRVVRDRKGAEPRLDLHRNASDPFRFIPALVGNIALVGEQLRREIVSGEATNDPLGYSWILRLGSIGPV